MVPLRPSLRIECSAAPSSHVRATRLEKSPAASHSHISFFRSLLLDLQIYSPTVKVIKLSGLGTSQSLPVFCDQDKIEGKVMLDPSCSQNGRLTVSLEGTLEYSSFEDNPDEYSQNPKDGKHRHVFLSLSATTPISPTPDSRLTIREALNVRRRSSASSLKSPPCRSCEFSFELPHWLRSGEMLPTFSSKSLSIDSRRQSHKEEFEVTYRITVVWEESDVSQPRAILEAPVLFQPDTDFQSCDVFTIEPECWLEIPLIPERPVPFNCAVTLPRPVSFFRCDSIPYFVVFATDTRSPCLIKEIAADATISVSLLREITIIPQRMLRSPALPDTPPASDESDSQTSPFIPYSRLLRRSVKTSSRSHTRDGSHCSKKTPSEFSQEVFSALRTLDTQLFIGFPKRPRAKDASQSLPDGLYKGKVQLSKDMLPSVDWAGISIKYYLEVSVLVGQDSMRVRVPIKVH